MPNIAIIGAGLSGLILAHTLKEHAQITLFEKARGVGGRMTTRYTNEFEFDHGVPFFEIHTKAFLEFLTPYIESGIIQSWDNTPFFVACPRMNSLAKALSQGLNIQLQHKIEDIQEFRENFDWMISTAPYPQTKALLPSMPDFPVEMTPCFVLMLGFESPLPLQANIINLKNPLIQSVIINSNKPHRRSGFSIVIQSTTQWSKQNLEMTDEWLIEQLINELRECLSFQINPHFISIHRWRFAQSIPHVEPYLWIDDQNKLAACGDWSMQGGVEGAFYAARTLGTKILERIK
jgi:renalase